MLHTFQRHRLLIAMAICRRNTLLSWLTGVIDVVTPGFEYLLAGRKFSDSRLGHQLHRNILAEASITNDSSGTVYGRLLALNGGVTLADEVLTYPPAIPPGGPGGAPLPPTPVPSSWMLIGLACIMLYQTRERWLRRLRAVAEPRP